MKGAMITVLLISSILLTGCIDECMIMDDIFGWIPTYECVPGQSSSSSSNSNNQVTGMATTEDDDDDEGGFLDGIKNALNPSRGNDITILDQNKIDNLPTPEELIGDTFMNTDPLNVAAPPAQRQCTYDQDCSSDNVKARCSGRYISERFQCDLRTYTCVGGKNNPAVRVDCRTEFGPNYVCSNGMCVRG